jgi:predicted MFS family arabinose efflux permease
MTRVRRIGRDTFASLHNRNYRLYFTGQIISVSGTWMQRLAQAWLVLSLTNNNGVWLGVETGLQFLPMLVFGAWGGVIADRWDKRKLLYCTQTAAGLLAFGLALLVWTDTATLPIVFAFSLALGFTNVFDMPARQTFVMEMVGREDLPNAVGLNSVVMNSSRVLGPAVGGVFIQVVGLAPCFFFNALSFVAVLIALRMMDGSKLQKQPVVPRAKGQLRDGLRYAWSDRMVRVPLLMMAVIGTLAFNFTVVIPLMATDVFGLDAGGFGALTAVMGLGAVLGALGAASRRGVSYKRLIGLSLAMGVAILAAAVAPTLPLEVVAIFFMGMSSFAFIATANTTMQLTSRPDMRGRVMALYGIAFLGSTPIGAPIVGWISAQWGPRMGFAVGGVVALLAAGAAWWSLHNMREQTEERLTDVAVRAAA